MRWNRTRLFDARLGEPLFRLQAMVIAAFASGSVTAGVFNLGGLALVYAARRVRHRRRCPARECFT